MRLRRRRASEGEVQKLIQKVVLRRFDFSKGAFLSASLLRLGLQEHVLILATHHIVSDAWSMGILSRELWALYEAFANKKPLPLEELPIQYSDFAVWQRDWLQGKVFDEQVNYWKENLASVEPLNTPTDRPRPPRQTFAGDRVPLSLPESLTIAINALSLQCNVTPFMTLLAAFQVLLYRYTGQEDITVGSPIANRSRSELEFLIGFFVNTLVLRSDLSGAPSFNDLLARVRHTCLSAYAHQDLPFEKLVEALNPVRDQSRNPLFQAMFVLQNATQPVAGPPSLQIAPVEIESTRSQFDLSLFLREREGRFIGYIEYNKDLFNRDRIERMIGHFQVLLEGIVADPEQSIATLPILTESERQRILVDWNNTAADYPKDKCIHQLFEEQVERTPNAEALVFDDERVTYGELNRRANQLAHHLIGLGVGPEKLVGLCLDRSIEMVVGLLGILKAGGAYVPLEPAYPTERLRFMLEDAGCDVLLTQRGFLAQFSESPVNDGGNPAIENPKSKIKNLVCFDHDWPEIAQQRDENLASATESRNLAYVIYTSGSTGKPKGVAIEHRNTANLLHWAKSVYSPSELAGVLAATSICFDLSVFELFLPLISGGKVILAENALRLHNLKAKNEITLVNTVPSVMAQLLTLGPLPSSVCTVNLAGELLKTELVNCLYEQPSVDKVYDLYGPTETTTYTTVTLRHQNGPETIGRPIANTQVYILDAALQPVPIGVDGELYIGGDGVTRGYLNWPELTIEKFVRDLFSNESSVSPFEKGGLGGGYSAARIYRTGDRARYCPNGNIEYLGRADDQVKIRGYRIELGEIEATLNQHPAVKECVIVVRDRDSSEDKELVGYFVPKEPLRGADAELQNFLKEKLPGYMVPTLLTRLKKLPLSPNGKIDRKALPILDSATRELDREFAAPRTEIEELVAQAWRQVLNVENLSIHDNFFEVGGYSLIGIQIVARLRETFDREIPLSALFDAPTVADLSSEVEKRLRDGAAPMLPPIVPVPRDGRPIPLSMNQEHLWRLDQMMPGTHFFNMPYVYRLKGDLNVEALEKALKEIVRRHEALRTTFGNVDGRPAQIIGDGSDFALANIDLRCPSSDEVSRKTANLIVAERQSPFDLALGPLLRTALLRLTDDDYLLLATMHHIISDHWSMQIFRRELLALYEAYSQRQPSPLPEPAVQFADYAVWERRALDLALFEKQLVYWTAKLAAPSGYSKAGTKRKRLTRQPARSLLYFEWTGSLFDALKEKAYNHNSTPYIYILSAIAIFVHAVTEHEEIRIATLAPNRQRQESNGTIGMFANTVILSNRVPANLTIELLLKQVRDCLFAAYQNQELPFAYLTRSMEIQSHPQRMLLPSVLVMHNHSFFGSAGLPGLSFAPQNFRELIEYTPPMPATYDWVFRVSESLTSLTGTVNILTHYRNAKFTPKPVQFITYVLKSMVERSDDQTVGGMLEGIG